MPKLFHPHQIRMNSGASPLFHFFFLKRYVISNNPVIANIALKPGVALLGVDSSFCSPVGAGAAMTCIVPVSVPSKDRLDIAADTTAILTVSLIKPLDPADITATPKKSSDVNSIFDKFVPASMTIEEFTYPLVFEIFTWMSASVIIGFPFSSNSLTVTVDVPPSVIVDGSAINLSSIGRELSSIGRELCDDTGMIKIDANNNSTKITTIFLFFIIFT